MKKKLLLALLFVFTFALILTACGGDRAVSKLEVIEGLKAEYELNEAPDYSGVKVLVTYNDGSTETVGADKLTISTLNTSIVGKTKITITYDGVTLDWNVEIKGNVIPDHNDGNDDAPYTLQSIEYLSGLPTSIYVGDAIDVSALKIIATYSNGSAEYDATISYKDGAISTDVATLDLTTAGVKAVNINFAGKTVSVNITVITPEIVKIEVDAKSINTVVEAGGELDLSNIRVYAIYDNGLRNLIEASKLDLTNIPDLSVEGQKDFVIYYTEGGKTYNTKVIITTEPPVLEGITLNLGTTAQKIVIGDKFSTAGITATALYSNNTTEVVANSALTFTYDDTAVGTMTVTAQYTDEDGTTASASVNIEILGITAISIDASTVSQRLMVGETLNTSAITVLITCSDGSRVERSVADGVTVDTANIDNSEPGNQSYITASYGGATSAALYITFIYDSAVDYFITETALPDSLTLFNNSKKQFKNQSYGYVIGDDNAFTFTLKLVAYNYSGVKIENLTRYTSASKVYLDGVALAGDELAQYVTIDESKNSFDFTEAAIGETFVIETRPKYGVSANDPSFSRQITVTIVDGYNIYEAWELNYMTNYDDFDFGDAAVYGDAETRTQTQIVDDYLRTEHAGAVRPAALNGIVIHNDLFIETGDIPKEYFLNADRTKELYDSLSVYMHITSDANPHFTIYGNYFTVCSNALPTVVAQGLGNQTDPVSNGQLFGFDLDPNVQTRDYDHTKYSTTVKNLYLRDNHPTKENANTANRDMRGLIGMKTWAQVINIDNTKVEAFYISLIVDSDYQTVNVKDSIYYNSWQNHLFLWSNNPIDDYDTYPIDNYSTLKFNAENSSFTKCGGPVIIAQTKNPAYNYSTKCGPIVNLSADCEIWTYVTGSEAWFVAMGVTSIASQIQGMNPILQSVGGSFLTTQPPVEGLSGGPFMNIIMINLASIDMEEGGVADALKGTDDIDGKLTIGDTVALDMTDTFVNTAASGLTAGYGNPYVSGAVQMINGTGAPVFASSAGGVGIFDGSALINLNSLGYPTGDLGAGDYMALYLNNMGIVLGYNMD